MNFVWKSKMDTKENQKARFQNKKRFRFSAKRRDVEFRDIDEEQIKSFKWTKVEEKYLCSWVRDVIRGKMLL